MRYVVPTKDRPGNLAMALAAITVDINAYDELVLYDDGERPAMADYGVRFALDIATQRGAKVVIQRGKPKGIAAARVKMLREAEQGPQSLLMMVDDDIILAPKATTRMLKVLDDEPDAQYVVPVIRLANNEAGVSGFTQTTLGRAPHQQYAIDEATPKRINGGAWTCAILLDLDRFDAHEAITRIESGPQVVEDYRLTAPMVGYLQPRAWTWHCMTGEQGDRGWETRALEYLREETSRGRT